MTVGVHRSWRLLAAVLLVAGIPLAVTLLSFLREITDLSVLTRTNPLREVAAGLAQRVELRLAESAAKLRALATDPEARGDDLSRYSPFVESGPFAALTVTHKNRRAVLPASGHLADDPAWAGLPPDGFTPLRFLADGRPVVAVVVNAEDGLRAAGLVDLERLLGAELVDRMRLARWGEVFIAAPDGRIFLSARRELVGRQVSELGLTPGPEGAEGLWRDDSGTGHWVGLAEPRASGVALRGWQVGLTVPEAVQARRNRSIQWVVAGIISVVLAITGGLLAVLLHSVRGPARGPL